MGWCFSCDGLRDIEDLSLDDHLAAVRRISSSLRSATPRWRWFTRTWDCESFHELDAGLAISREVDSEDFQEMANQLEEAIIYIEYLSRRTAPPRCLKCASHDVERLTKRETDDFWGGWNHPGCGGTLVMSSIGSLNLAPSTTRLVYELDGTFLCEEAEPAPKVLPKFLPTAD
jgi:hypothetical protein